MRILSASFRTAASAVSCALVCSTAQAHPGHGDAAHFIAGGPHTESQVHDLLADPWFAAVLLAVSALVLGASTWLASRPRSLKLTRPLE